MTFRRVGEKGLLAEEDGDQGEGLDPKVEGSGRELFPICAIYHGELMSIQWEVFRRRISLKQVLLYNPFRQW